MEAHSEIILQVAYNLLLAVVVFLAAHLVAKGVKRIILRTNDRLERFDETLTPIFCTTSTYLIYILAIAIVLDIFGVNTASIITLLGAAGLSVGFALKDTLSNIAAGIMLLFLRPFRSGDFIEFASIMGTVREINLFTTVLETFDGLYVSSPNSVIWGSSIKNFNRNGKRRMDLVVGISYGDSIDKGFEVLREIVASDGRFLKDPAPQIMVQALADSSVNLQLRAWARVEVYWNVVWEHNKIIKEKIEAAGLTIPFPQRDVHVHEVSKV